MREPIGLVFDASTLAGEPFFARRIGPVPVLHPPALREDVRRCACRGWEDRTRAEYVGVLIVRRFHGLLVEVNAPADVQELALSMLLQEQQHVRLCLTAARSLGSAGEIAFEPYELAPPRTREPLTDRLLGMIVDTYAVGEVVALALLRHAIAALPPGGYRDVLRAIARDEVLHARIGPALLREARAGVPWLPWPGEEEVAARALRTVERMRARDVIEPDEARLFEDAEAAAQLASVGIPPSLAFRAAYLKALEEAAPAAFARAGFSRTIEP